MTPMQTMIHHTTLVTADDACTVQEDAAIVVEADRIVAVGPTAALLARYPAAERTLRVPLASPGGGPLPVYDTRGRAPSGSLWRCGRL